VKFASIIAALVAALATPAAAESLDRPTLSEPRPFLRDLAPPSVACPDAQTITEVEAMRRLGDRESEWITQRSYGCGPPLRPRPGPFER
jgi:hypothetical protein